MVFYYFGEFGFFCAWTIGRFGDIIGHNTEPIEIWTLPDYAKILQHYYGDKVKCYQTKVLPKLRFGYSCQDSIKDLGCQTMDGNDMDMPDKLKDIGRGQYLDQKSKWPLILKPLFSGKKDNKLVLLFPRFRSVPGITFRNLEIELAGQIAKWLLSHDYHVATIGHLEESKQIPNIPHYSDILEVGQKLSECRLLITPNSGMGYYASHCGCSEILVLLTQSQIDTNNMAEINDFGCQVHELMVSGIDKIEKKLEQMLG